MYRVVSGIISRHNKCIAPRPQVGDITQRWYSALQCNRRADTSLNRCASRSFYTSFFQAALPIWMYFTAYPLLLSAICGRCLKWAWRDIPMSTPPEVWDLIITKKRVLLSSWLTLSSVAFLIYISGLQKDPISKRRRFIGLTKEQINELAELQMQDAQFFVMHALPQSDSRYSRLHKVMKRLLKANHDFERVREKNWDVFLIEAPFYANALALHDGKVFVFSGMLQMCTTDDQLAFVLSHELSHVLLLHMPERFSKMHLTDLLLLLPLILIWAIMSFRGALVAHYMVMYLTELLIHLPAKRKLEYEADSVGLELAAKACYDVRDASVFWHKVQILLWISDGKPLEWISTHPGCKARRKRLDKQMPKALGIRAQNSCPKLSRTDPRIVISDKYRRLA